MTGIFEVLAHDDSENRKNSHKAAVLAKTRVDNEYGKFITAHGESALEYLESEIAATVHIAAAEVGYADAEGLTKQIVASYREQPAMVIGNEAGTFELNQRTASTVHEARKPKMCPFHRDVVDISLASQDPRAGFDAMAQHWGGPRHCDGAEYEGDKCKFKPQMTTQSYWDERQEKLEQKRQERAERAEEAPIPEAEPENDPATDDVPEVGEDQTPEIEDTPEQTTEPVEDNVIEVDFGSAEVEAPADGTEVPMSMAASTKVADGAPVPKMDKRKWTPNNLDPVYEDDPNGPHPTRRKDIIEPVRVDNSGKPSEIGEQVTERQDVTQDHEQIVGETGTFTEGPKTAVSSHDPQKNELVEIMKDDFDGFLPQAEVQKAVLAHRNR
jgi:hypothetical protein